MRNLDDIEEYRSMYVTCANLLSPYLSFYRSVQERGLVLTVYSKILKLIPKLRKILKDPDCDEGESYVDDVIDAVHTNAHISCDAMT
jgi:hypothetical protein